MAAKLFYYYFRGKKMDDTAVLYEYHFFKMSLEIELI